MKKTLLTLALLASTSITFAQQSLNFGVKAGVNFATQVFSPARKNLDFPAHTLTAFNVGLVADFGFKHFSIQPGLFLTTKGEQFNDIIVGGDAVSHTPQKYKLTYLEIPLNFLYRIPLSNDNSIHIGGGPYFGYGVSAKVTSDEGDIQGTFSNDGSYTVAYKNPDLGANFLAGIKLQKYLFDVQYGLGLADISYSGNSSLRNRVFSVSIGYMF